MRAARLLLGSCVVGLLCAAGCEDDKPAAPTAPKAETRSPPKSPVPYEVLLDEKVNGQVEYHLLVPAGTRHDPVDDLLKFVYRHLMTRHEDPPPGLAGFVYNSRVAFETPPRTPVATVVKKSSDLGPTFENRVPLELSQEIDQAIGPRSDKGWKLARVLTVDEAAHTLTVRHPYTAMGEDRWADNLSFNQAMQAFTDTALKAFSVPELRAMTFVGLWKDAEVVKVELSRTDYSALKLNELDERVGQHHGRIYLEMMHGQQSKMSVEQANASATKQMAGLIGKEYRNMLKQLKGKATVAGTLK